GNVRVIDTATNATVASIDAGLAPFGIAVNAAGTRVYVSDVLGDALLVIDAAANRVSRTIRVGIQPTGIAVNSAGTRLYVANSGEVTGGGTVSVIDGASEQVVGAIRVGNGPFGLALSPDGARLYVTNTNDGTVSVVDTASQATVATIAAQGIPIGVAIAPDGARVYVTQSVASSNTASVLVIDTATNAAVGTVPVGVGSTGIDVNPAGTRAYVANGGMRDARGSTVTVIDTASLGVVATIPVGTTPQGIAVHPSGARVYVTNTNSNTVSVIDAGTNSVVATIPVGISPVSFGRFIGPAVFPTAANYQGLWWKSPPGSESGWGVNIAHQGEILFATWFTYDTDGSGLWLVMSNGTLTGPGTYSGLLYRTRGFPFDADPWPSGGVGASPVGNATFSFADADNGTFTYSVGGVTQSKPITRQLFASPVPVCTAAGAAPATPNFQDLWWRSPAGSQPGWGVNITHQGDILFATWFTYDASGNGQWLVMSNGARTASATYSGTLFRTRGPAFSANPWNRALVNSTAVGNATFTFTDANNGTFAYTLDGVAQVKPITRQVFASPPTVCK
ncbi:MAG TPA: YncE family protein, partial [Usitatibacter sp.]|nr:YncE family protein [Usitatibacter sp.]